MGPFDVPPRRKVDHARTAVDFLPTASVATRNNFVISKACPASDDESTEGSTVTGEASTPTSRLLLRPCQRRTAALTPRLRLSRLQNYRYSSPEITEKATAAARSEKQMATTRSNIAVRLIQSVMGALMAITAVAGGLVLLGLIARLLWRHAG